MQTPAETESETPNIPPLFAYDPVQKTLAKPAVLWYSMANLGCGAFFSFNNYVLPLFLQKYTNNAILLGLMGSSHSVEGAIVQPLVGSASDSLRTKWGRRRPFMLIFLSLSALFLALTPLATLLPGAVRLPAIIGAIFLFTVLFNIGFDPYQALMPDITPPEQRGRVQGVWGLFGNFAQAAILPLALFLSLSFQIQFWIVAGVMIVTTLITCKMIQEPAIAPSAAKKKSLAREVREALRGLRTLRQAAKAMIVLALSGAGIGAVTPYLTLFVKSVTGCTNGQAQMMAFVLMIATVVGVLPFGWLTDKIGPKRVIQIGFSLLVAACLSAFFIHTLPQVMVVMTLAGWGNAAQVASVYPMLTDIVPRAEVGFYTGFQSTMLSITQPVTVVLTGMLINRGGGGYRVVFLVCALCIIAAMIVLTFVKQTDSVQEIAARNREMGREA